jgi:hypothetical protein
VINSRYTLTCFSGNVLLLTRTSRARPHRKRQPCFVDDDIWTVDLKFECASSVGIASKKFIRKI